MKVWKCEIVELWKCGSVEMREEGNRDQGSGISVGYEGRLVYLRGYREGTDEERVRLLKDAICGLCEN